MSVAVLATFQSKFQTSDPSKTYPEQAQEAAYGAMTSVGMTPDDIDAIVFSLAPTFFMGVADADRWSIDYIFGAGKPMFRVHTGGATGGSAVHAAQALVASGVARSVLIVGAERIAETPDAQKVLNLIFDAFYERDMPLSTNTTVALALSRYLQNHGLTEEDMAQAVVRQRRNAMSNPHAHLKGDITIDDVMNSKPIALPLKLFDICPRSSGSAAMIIGNEDMAKRFQSNPAFITGISGVTDTYWIGDRITPTSTTDWSSFKLTEIAGRQAFKRAGITDPMRQLQVVELYDPYSCIGYQQLEHFGFCAPGVAPRLDKEGVWDVKGGQVAVNPSGGTLCTNPIAISGLVRAIDAASQIMGTAGAMQVPNTRYALSTANGGIGQFINVTVFGHEPNAH
ncbi:MAG: thiolase family protein [Hyphomicrobiales bacterium]|nr:MAG: thiolase family protein [Hyphomicrobiales bacterium]